AEGVNHMLLVEEVPRKEGVLRRKRVVQTPQKVILMRDLICNLVDLSRSSGGVKVESRHRIQSQRTDDAVVANRVRRPREGWRAVGGLGKRSHLGLSQQLPDPFVIHEKECFVLLQRAAQAASGLIPAERDDSGVEQPARVQGAVPDELIGGAMQA